MSAYELDLDRPTTEKEKYLAGYLDETTANDLRTMMSTECGRRVVYWMINSVCELAGQVWDLTLKYNPEYAAAKKDGRRDAGGDLFEIVQALTPYQSGLMMNERTEAILPQLKDLERFKSGRDR